MKAVEFVKKFGLDAAKHKADEVKIIESMGDKLSFEDENLKRLVESHELVERIGGLSLARQLSNNFVHVTIDLDVVQSRTIQEAIIDVYSCQ